MNHRRLALLQFALLPAALKAEIKPSTTASTLTFGVVPQQAAVELARIWVPMIGLVSQRCGIGLRFATAPDIPTFEKRLLAGQYDIAYMNPYHYTTFHQKPGYEAFAKEKGRSLKGIVVVHKDAPYKTLEDLRGADIAFPAPAAFAATVLVRAELQKMGIPHTPKFVNSHESVYLNVSRKIMPAGGGIPRTLQGMDMEIRRQLRILHSTSEYSPHAFAFHPRVNQVQARAIMDAMQSLDKDSAGQAVLSDLGFKGIDLAKDAQWNDVRRLGVRTLAKLLKE